MKFWIFGFTLVVAVVATVVCLLKGRRIHALVGVGTSSLMVRLVMDSRQETSTDLAFGELFILVAFVVFGLPLTILVVAGALQPGKPSSWWAKRPSTDEER